MDENLKIETEPEKGQSKIPGFRSGKTWKKVVAVIGYVFIGLILLGIILPSPDNTSSNNLSTPAVAQKDPLEASKEAYTIGLEQYNKKNYELALGFLSKVIPDDPNYQDAQTKITEIKTKEATKYLASAKTNLQNNNFDSATSDLNKTLEYAPDNQEATALLASIPAQKAAYEEQKKQQEIVDFKNSCEVISYKVLNKNPDSLAGQNVKLRGQIMQIQEDAGKTFMLLSVTYMGYDVWTDNVAVYYEGTADVYEDDVITIWGTVTGKFEYDSVAGWKMSVPGVLAKYVAKG